MNSPMDFFQKVAHFLTRKRELDDKIDFKGNYPIIEHWRNGQKIGEYSMPNGITNAGKNYVLDAGFNGGSQVPAGSWCIGLIDSTGFTALAAADTLASHGGWTEFTTYSQITRPAWGQGAAASQAVTNSTPITFDITAGGVLKGIAICSNTTKGGTSGTLWSTAQFTTDVPVANGDQLKITYSLGC